jgi:DNA-binding Lrp family transcriptional regulator
MNLDKVDVSILRSLQLDARTKYSDIASECDVAVDTIIKRFKKLMRKGVVKRTTILLDPRKFGKEVIANMNIDVEPDGLEVVLNYLSYQDGVLFATHAMGQFDVVAITASNSMNEMNRLKESIQSHKMVREVKTSIWVDRILLCPQNFEIEKLLEST